MVSVPALILSLVAHQILGYAWYSPAPWAVARLKAIGRPATDVSRVDPYELCIDVVGWVFYTLVVEFVMQRANVKGTICDHLHFRGESIQKRYCPRIVLCLCLRIVDPSRLSHEPPPQAHWAVPSLARFSGSA